MNLHPVYYLVLGACLAGQAYADQLAPRPPSSTPGPTVQVQPLDTPPDFAPTAAPSGTDVGGELMQSVSIVGRPVQNLQGQLLGQVDGVLVSVDGRVQAVVLATGGLLGWGQDRYEVPWARVHWQHDGDYLTLDVGSEQVKAEFSAFETE